MLYGPDSNPKLLEAVVCESWTSELKSFEFSLYTRAGKKLLVDIQCIPSFGGDGKLIATSLQFKILPGNHRDNRFDSIDIEQHLPVHLIRSNRSRYNFLIGLSIQQDLNHQIQRMVAQD